MYKKVLFIFALFLLMGSGCTSLQQQNAVQQEAPQENLVQEGTASSVSEIQENVSVSPLELIENTVIKEGESSYYVWSKLLSNKEIAQDKDLLAALQKKIEETEPSESTKAYLEQGIAFLLARIGYRELTGRSASMSDLFFEDEQYWYFAYEIYPVTGWEPEYDQKFTRVDKQTGDEIIILKSVAEEFASLFGQDNAPCCLEVAARPENQDLVIFRNTFPESDNPFGQLFAFDVQTNGFSELSSINGIYNGRGDEVLSPHQRFALVVLNEDTGDMLYLLDLVQDTYRIALSLSEEETFIFSTGITLNIDVAWLDEDTVRYGVYQKSENGNEAKLIEYREADLLL